MWTRSASTLLWASCLAACADDPLSRLTPKIAADPPMLDFGDGVVGADNPKEVQIQNLADGVLEISAARIEPAGVFRTEQLPEAIAPHGSVKHVVVFVPQRPHEVYDASLIISSNDPEKPELTVPLHGVGGVREIEVFPPMVDFGIVDEGTTPKRAIEIRNLGGDPLVVSSVTWTSTSVDMGLVANTFTAGPIAPGERKLVEVQYSPKDLGGDRGVVTIQSNDEDEPSVTVQVIGRANLAPLAIAWGCDIRGAQIGCDNAMKARRFTLGVRQRINLDGRESADPEGSRLMGFRWQVVTRPANSSAVPFFTTQDTRDRQNATGDFEVDAVGIFDVRLIVRDARGLESFDRPESHVQVTPKDLEVLLRWDVSTDVDLHLVRPGGTVGDYGTPNAPVGTSTGSDCSSFNRAPNWGDLATNADDPRLDIDDVSGRGPEIISTDRPEAQGAYAVYAHYCDSHGTRVPVNVTVEVYVRGQKIAQVPEAGRTFTLASGELWRAAEVRWDPARMTVDVVPGTGDLPTRAPTLCTR